MSQSFKISLVYLFVCLQTMATSAVNPLENHISCSVCLEVYTDPHILRCLHTFCYQCIQGVKQGNQVQCPECRQYTDVSEVKKDFKMDSLIAINIHALHKDDNPQETVCDLCEDSTKPVQSFCTNCEECLCANCSKAHGKSKATKDHKLIQFADLQKSKKQEMDKYIKTITDEERDMGSKYTRNRELIENVKEANVRQFTEVNQLRDSIIEDVNSHHDSLLSHIQSINQNTIQSLEQQVEMFTEARQQLVGKKQFLAAVLQTQDITLLTDILNNMSDQLKPELAAIHSTLQQFDMDVMSSVKVVKGMDWNPVTSTRVELADTTSVGGTESPYHSHSPGIGSSSHEVVGIAAVGGTLPRYHAQSPGRGLSLYKKLAAEHGKFKRYHTQNPESGPTSNDVVDTAAVGGLSAHHKQSPGRGLSFYEKLAAEHGKFQRYHTQNPENYPTFIEEPGRAAVGRRLLKYRQQSPEIGPSSDEEAGTAVSASSWTGLSLDTVVRNMDTCRTHGA